jgi:hypothetical protein
MAKGMLSNKAESFQKPFEITEYETRQRKNYFSFKLTFILIVSGDFTKKKKRQSYRYAWILGCRLWKHMAI